MADMVLADVASLMQTVTGYTPESTGQVLLETMQLMGEPVSSRSAYNYSVLSISNRLISELFDINNAIRKKNGKATFTEYPILKTLSDTVPFEYETISNIFIYGLAYWLFVQDEEYTKANAMLAQYERGMMRAPAHYELVTRII